jgi:DNA-binding MarR family transcriptional regulator
MAASAKPAPETQSSVTQAAPPAPLRLDHYLPYLINRAGVSLASRFGAELRHAGISLQDWRVLAALCERDGQRLTELARHTSIEISTLSRLVGGLEARGLVARDRDAGDARAIAIRLTDAGTALTVALTPAAASLERAALAGLSATEAEQLKALLNRIYGNLAALADEDASGGAGSA